MSLSLFCLGCRVRPLFRPVCQSLGQLLLLDCSRQNVWLLHLLTIISEYQTVILCYYIYVSDGSALLFLNKYV